VAERIFKAAYTWEVGVNGTASFTYNTFGIAPSLALLAIHLEKIFPLKGIISNLFLKR
jgi:hypothetical protein